MLRRQFLKSTGLLSFTPFVPGFVNELAGHTLSQNDKTVLVVIELSGGNDGINTVVPFTDDGYSEHRKSLRLESKDLHKLADNVALHSSMRGAKELFDHSQLAIVQGVGYPNPNRSHFESMAIWHSGQLQGKRRNGAGWIGEALDRARRHGRTGMDGYFIGSQALTPALIGRRAQVAALSRFSDMQLNTIVKPDDAPNESSDIASFVQRQVSDSYRTARQIEAIAQRAKSTEDFPDTELGQKMKLVSQLIKSGSAARVYYAAQDGYDTHSAQRYTHSRLLFDFSNAVKALIDDLIQHSLDDRVIVMAFSEFGRRVRENASQGTDHGTAGPVFLAGTKVKSGLHGLVPSLTDLEDGDIKVQFDFRQVYATLLDLWLEIPSTDVLGQSFDLLPIIG